MDWRFFLELGAAETDLSFAALLRPRAAGAGAIEVGSTDLAPFTTADEEDSSPFDEEDASSAADNGLGSEADPCGKIAGKKVSKLTLVATSISARSEGLRAARRSLYPRANVSRTPTVRSRRSSV